jgi:dihydrofolate reductase
MAKLIYSGICSLDGYVADKDGDFSWARPDDELHAFVNELERPIGTYLYGRRMYETMVFWETAEVPPGQCDPASDYVDIWRAAEKVIFSRTLERASSAKTRIEREFDPEEIRRLVGDADRDLSIGGSELAGEAITAGLVDEYHLFINPIVVGGGTAALPSGARVELELADQRRFASGVIHVHYRSRGRS